MEVLGPGALFSLSVDCFGKQDCQICRERGGAFEAFASMVWLMTLICSKDGSEFSLQACSPVHNVSPKN